MHGTRTVLLVQEDDAAAERLGGWLASDGYWVLTCAGPLASTYACPGGRGEACPLADLADVVVLDTWLDSDTMMDGPPAWQLLLYYLSIGKRVVAMAAPGDPVDLASDERHVIVLRRPPEREELLSAVRALLALAQPGPLPSPAPTIPLRRTEDVPSSVIDLTERPAEPAEAKGRER